MLADAAEAAKVAKHESLVQKSEFRDERRGRDRDREQNGGQNMRPGRTLHLAIKASSRQHRSLCVSLERPA